MSTSTRVLGTVITLGLVAFVASNDGLGVRLINIPTFLIVAGFAVVGIWTCFGSNIPWRALKSSLGVSAELDETAAELYLGVFKRGYQLTWAGCLLGVSMGTIYMLQNADEGAMWLVSSTIHMALLHVMYATIIAEVGFRNLGQWLTNRTVVACSATDASDQPSDAEESHAGESADSVRTAFPQSA